MVIRTYDEADQALVEQPADPGSQRGGERPWWAGMDATKTRHEVICPGTQHRVGLIVSPDEHLVFREHVFKTYSGKIRCPRSLQPVCEVAIPNRTDVMCPHDHARRAEARSA